VLEASHEERAHDAAHCDRVSDVRQLRVAIPLWVLIPKRRRSVAYKRRNGLERQPQRLAEEDEVGPEPVSRGEDPPLCEREADVATKAAIVDEERRVSGPAERAFDAALDALGSMAAENEDSRRRRVTVPR
jgi:hypothetical protein